MSLFCGNIFLLKCLVLILLFLCTACGVQPWSLDKAQQYQEEGKPYDALTSAIGAYQFESQRAHASEMIKEVYPAALAQAKVDLLSIKPVPENIGDFLAKSIEIKGVQEDLIKYQFISHAPINIDEISTQFYDTVSSAFVDKFNKLLADNKFEQALAMLEDSQLLSFNVKSKSGLHKQLASSYQEACIANDKHDLLIKFIKANNKEATNASIEALLKVASVAEKSDKRKALEIYRSLKSSELHSDLVDQKIKVLEKHLYLTIGFACENTSDEILPVKNEEIIKRLADRLGNQEKLIKTVSAFNLMDDLDIEDNLYTYLIKEKNAAKLNGKANMLLLLSIKKIKINHDGPRSQKRQTGWNSARDGIMATAVASTLAYGSGTVQYFEFDEFEESINGQLIARYVLFDVASQKLIKKERFEVRAGDTATWGANPMAVGTINRVRATAMPSHLVEICNKTRGVKSQDQIEKELLEKALTELSDRTGNLISQK